MAITGVGGTAHTNSGLGECSSVADVDYRKISVLVADDFSNFRTTVSVMLDKLGVRNVDLASTGEQVLEECQNNAYDLILCDYDLGEQRNGQQVLEELRFKNTIGPKTLFVLVSADAAKDAVMAAFDCAPDDYLMKPITAGVLRHRLNRLLVQRSALGAAHSALESKDIAGAVGLLTGLSLSESRSATAAQKLLGSVLLKEGELDKAENLYRQALKSRPLDWARLGLAKTLHAQGHWAAAKAALEQLVSDSPLYLPAYDALAEGWESEGDAIHLQGALQKSVDVSPKSILRQKRLAAVAERNGDYPTAIDALRSTVRLGVCSCHAAPDDNFSFARVSSTGIEKQFEPPKPLAGEAARAVGQAREGFSLTSEQLTRADLIEGRAHILAGDPDRGRSLITSLQGYNRNARTDSVQLKVERIQALQTLGELDSAGKLIQEMLGAYEFNQGVLQMLDTFLDEPVSEFSRAFIAGINREGIDLYNQSRNDEALACFSKARRLFPKHVGIQLNIVQALIGKLGSDEAPEAVATDIQQALLGVGDLIDSDHSQYARFVSLQNMASASAKKLVGSNNEKKSS